MSPLAVYPLPLSSFGPPDGFGWWANDISDTSNTTAFDAGINERDRFLGKKRCVICGAKFALQHCHIIPKAESDLWVDLKDRSWIPEGTKDEGKHEPRNGLMLCANHHLLFDTYVFFIRFVPDIRKFVVVNYSDKDDLRQFHGKAVSLDTTHHYSPFSSLFLIHEWRVRGFNPFLPIDPDMPASTPWQDWICTDGVVSDSGSLIRKQPPRDRDAYKSTKPPTTSQHAMTSADSERSGQRRLGPPDENLIAEILAATHAMPSWKACQVECTSWTGTAEENIQKYVSAIGVEDSSGPVHRQRDLQHLGS